ncbi:MAG: GTPase HflX [Rhodospirillaceae bacterium]
MQPPEHEDGRTRAVVLHPYEKSRSTGSRSLEARLDEAIGLAEAIDLDVVASECVPLPRVRAGTYFGSGTVERIGELVEEAEADIVSVDTSLTPVQQRTLEKAWNTKVIDRTGLILEIFGERARTREGVLQVELAHLTYQRSRLVRSWTHLERQRGGFGFLGGPGETQIEADRRMILERITRIRRELETVTRTRELHREARRRVPYPVIALVGYTNAGKSTLFNRLTDSDVFAKDLLFATLDPTMRAIELPSGRSAILSDTVGFVSDLPTTLIAAFRATLEEVIAADIIVHVRDIAHPDTGAQKADVERVLAELGIVLGSRTEEGADRGYVEVFNKVDLLDEEQRAGVENLAGRSSDVVMLSALSGENCPQFLEKLDLMLSARQDVVRLTLTQADGKTISWLYRNADVLSRDDEGEFAHFEVSISPDMLARFEKNRALH